MKKCRGSVRVTAITCSSCGDTIFSRARHDFRSCACGDCHIDGGFEYIKVSCRDSVMITHKRITLKGVTKQMLYDDWNYRTDKYGRIPREKS